jgi:hypothetical protein
VPLPFLLYRAQTRYEDGLQEIREALSPTATLPTQPQDQFMIEKPVNTTTKALGRMVGSTVLSRSGRLNTNLGVRARLSSFGSNSPRSKKPSSSSILTLQGAGVPGTRLQGIRPASPSSEATDSEDEEADKEEEADRNAEEQEALDRKLEALQKMITNDKLGLVKSSRTNDKAREINRGRMGMSSPGPSNMNTQPGEPSSRSTSQSVSSESSAHGSIPSIMSPSSGSQAHSPMTRQFSTSKSPSSAAVSPRSAHGQKYGPFVGRSVSEQGSNYGSEASSFSDISGRSSPGMC